ncbi:hypothetical protein Tco_0555202, partial [Tanacetum coccineum]
MNGWDLAFRGRGDRVIVIGGRRNRRGGFPVPLWPHPTDLCICCQLSHPKIPSSLKYYEPDCLHCSCGSSSLCSIDMGCIIRVGLG